MAAIQEQTTRLFARRTENPKTILAFYATVLGLVLAAAVGAITALAATDTSIYLIPWLMGFAALLVVALVFGVFWMTTKDPSRLMLGRVTGDEYAAIQQVILGNSETGERLAPATDSPSHLQPQVLLPPPMALGERTGDDQEEEKE